MAGLRSLETPIEAKAVFFYKTMTTTMVDGVSVHPPRLEFPTLFVHDHGKEFGEDVALERRTCGTVWRLKLQVLRYSDEKPRVYTSGDGWGTFVLENRISVGDLLIFQLVEYSRFLVHVYPPDANVTPYQHISHRLGNARRSGEEESELLNSSRKVNEEDMSQGRPTRPSSPSDKVALETRFMRVLCPSHCTGRTQKLNIPLQFWRSHGCDMFDRRPSDERSGESFYYFHTEKIQMPLCRTGMEIFLHGQRTEGWRYGVVHPHWIRMLCRFSGINYYRTRAKT